jgi:nucleoside-diphosphate-sugar epimerase
MKIAILGSTGLIGNRLTQRLNSKYTVIPISRKELDLSKEFINEGILQQSSLLVFCAQSSDKRDENIGKTLEEYYRENGKIIEEIDKNCNSIRHIIFLSTGGLYEKSSNPVVETSKLKSVEMMDRYFTAKFETEKYLNQIVDKRGITILRLFSVYGKESKPNRLFPKLQHAILNEKAIRISNNGGDFLRPTNVEDVVNSIEVIIDKSVVGTFNIAGPTIMNMRSIILKMSDNLNRKAHILETEIDPIYIAPEIGLMQQKIFSPRYEFDGNWQI